MRHAGLLNCWAARFFRTDLKRTLVQLPIAVIASKSWQNQLVVRNKVPHRTPAKYPTLLPKMMLVELSHLAAYRRFDQEQTTSRRAGSYCTRQALVLQTLRQAT